MPVPITATIETPRLLLEPLGVHHAEEMARVLDDPRLHRYIGGEPLTLGELRARYEHLVAGPSPYHQEQWLNWIVRRRRDGQAVGTVQVTVTPEPGGHGPRAAVAWVIGMPYQGFGFASEAARALLDWLTAHGVRNIVANVHPGNLASAAVARRAGLRPTGETADDEVVWRHLPGG
ncbi:GNAT family N-acetyltransferase [Actinomadura viridis]|uniref:RimJ/RimL family protein N-acetyltransferase n=1 Tax=Actinomadura viridis TaxID=58110 RepID=A0A931GLC8_9ACTN|nr:GNAT family N-acetyltransferase [Actinomadura viridis]MBG6090950.1 RimJ/RimL family protein N-acetyltransferase [Actinomadura viridis]